MAFLVFIIIGIIFFCFGEPFLIQTAPFLVMFLRGPPRGRQGPPYIISYSTMLGP